jgi:indole-3-glycerol phosphate synthase
MSDILDKILATKREEVAAARKAESLETVREAAEWMPPARDFVGAAVIAEIKKASPSKGVIRADFRPADIAAELRAAWRRLPFGADRPPVLPGRAGLPEGEARAACSLPVLRKDFWSIPGRSTKPAPWAPTAILLIVAALPLAQMREMEAIAHELGMAVLVECHDGAELDVALQLKTPLIGINNRNLRTFESARYHWTCRSSAAIPAAASWSPNPASSPRPTWP